MEYIIKKPANKHLLVLVHGLNGANISWKGIETRFVENLIQEQLIQDNFNIAIFTYGTKIFKINWLTKIINLVKGFFQNHPNEDIKGFNIGINSISENLESEIRNIHKNYESISIIAHSMGGLVTKSSLTWMTDGVRKKVELFISLSVPHIGSYLGQIGSSLLGDNPQIIDLQGMGTFTTQLNQRYADLTPRPRLIYQSGNQDTVVPRQSAIPPNVSINDTITTPDDHFSVLLIKDRTNNQVFAKVIEELGIVLQPFAAIDVGVSEGIPFKFFLETLASKLKFKVSFERFSEDELNSKLRADNISSTTIEELFFDVASLTIVNFPKFTVNREKGTLNFVISKT